MTQLPDPLRQWRGLVAGDGEREVVSARLLSFLPAEFPASEESPKGRQHFDIQWVWRGNVPTEGLKPEQTPEQWHHRE